jgi:hypothetical protein
VQLHLSFPEFITFSATIQIPTKKLLCIINPVQAKKGCPFEATLSLQNDKNYFDLLTVPAKSEPALNFTTFLAAILISFPV